MKWQDSTKVIITQKLHRIRNWEFQSMWNGMCTIEMIENVKIENSTKIWVCAISPYHRRLMQRGCRQIPCAFDWCTLWITSLMQSRTIPHWTIPHWITLTRKISPPERFPTRTITNMDNSPLGQLPTWTTLHQDNSPSGQLSTRTIHQQDRRGVYLGGGGVVLVGSCLVRNCPRGDSPWWGVS